ncbi:hypothetical protein PAHAL_3G284300 [Panicum hallii]|uniref:Uncharacterized protein n=1 Tax=Panicum hallii TaxID=206008 RepID=A0A2T8KJR1_9POAL|nr:hypothetical protein PAHAL_3G284300 [Panicum hallii]
MGQMICVLLADNLCFPSFFDFGFKMRRPLQAILWFAVELARSWLELTHSTIYLVRRQNWVVVSSNHG